MPPTTTPPSVFSLAFHTKFFPALLWQRLRPGKREQTTVFVPAGVTEQMIILTVAGVLIAVGLPAALKNMSIAGIIAAAIGCSGLILLAVIGIRSRIGIPPSYDAFLVGGFFFFVVAGLTGGVIAGVVKGSVWLKLAGGVGGAIAGYVVGIAAGLWLQYIGWLATALNALAALACAGLLVVDVILVFSA